MLERTAWWAHLSHAFAVQFVMLVNTLDRFVASVGPTHFAFGMLVMVQAGAHVALGYLTPARRQQSIENLSASLQVLCPSMPTFFAAIHGYARKSRRPCLVVVDCCEKIANDCSCKAYTDRAA